MHRPVFVFLFGALLLAILAAEAGHALWRQSLDVQKREAMRHLVARLGLTDLALFTEARYTRHPSQADLFAPFQDAPVAFEHFPTGSLLVPPRHWGPERAVQQSVPSGVSPVPSVFRQGDEK